MDDLHHLADLRLERMSHHSWQHSFEILSNDSSLGEDWQGHTHLRRDLDFETCKALLQGICDILHDVRLECDDVKRRAAKQLQWNNIQLLNILPTSYKILARSHLEQLILQDLNIGLTENEMMASRVSNHDLGILIAVKVLIEKERKGLLGERPELLLTDTDIKVVKQIEQHTQAYIEKTNRCVLVEWVQYTFAWADDETGKQFRDRVESIAVLMHNSDKMRIPRTLRCHGYLHAPARRAFGVVYDFPVDLSKNVEVMTLNQILHSRGNTRPMLEERAKLGHIIAQTIYQFHSVGWLHRNLNPTNVAFFPAQVTPKTVWATQPFVIGFSSSRQNEDSAATLGPSNLLDYHHPAYLQEKGRFCEEYDYYSVGMMLLEIGHWAPLSRIIEDKKFSGLKPQDFRDMILKYRVPQISITMGSRYLNVVRRCLTSDFGALDIVDAKVRNSTLRENFKREILDVLESLVGILGPQVASN